MKEVHEVQENFTAKLPNANCIRKHPKISAATTTQQRVFVVLKTRVSERRERARPFSWMGTPAHGQITAVIFNRDRCEESQDRREDTRCEAKTVLAHEGGESAPNAKSFAMLTESRWPPLRRTTCTVSDLCLAWLILKNPSSLGIGGLVSRKVSNRKWGPAEKCHQQRTKTTIYPLANHLRM